MRSPPQRSPTPSAARAWLNQERFKTIDIVWKHCLRATYLKSVLCHRAHDDNSKDISSIIVHLSVDVTEPDASPFRLIAPTSICY